MASVATLAPAIYSQPPSPVIGRRYRDSDRVARAASEILMRCLSDAIEETDLDERFLGVRAHEEKTGGSVHAPVALTAVAVHPPVTVTKSHALMMP